MITCPGILPKYAATATSVTKTGKQYHHHYRQHGNTAASCPCKNALAGKAAGALQNTIQPMCALGAVIFGTGECNL